MIKFLTPMLFFLVNFISLNTLNSWASFQNVFFNEYAEGSR